MGWVSFWVVISLKLNDSRILLRCWLWFLIRLIIPNCISLINPREWFLDSDANSLVFSLHINNFVKIWDAFREFELCGGDKHLRKNSMNKGGSSNYLKQRRFFLNIVVFSFTIKKGKVYFSKTSESLKYFALTTYFTALHIYFHFASTSIILWMTR